MSETKKEIIENLKYYHIHFFQRREIKVGYRAEKMWYEEKNPLLLTLDSVQDNGTLYSISDPVHFRHQKHFRRKFINFTAPPKAKLNAIKVPRNDVHFVIFGFVQIVSSPAKKRKKRIAETFCVIGYAKRKPLLDYYYSDIVTKDDYIIVYPPEALEIID